MCDLIVIYIQYIFYLGWKFYCGFDINRCKIKKIFYGEGGIIRVKFVCGLCKYLML